jgi:hypothetical protein
VSDSDRPMVRLGGLWRRKSRAGVEYLGGSLGNGELLVFRNDRRRSDRDPEYTIFVAERRERETARTGSPGWSPQSPGPAESHTPRSDPPPRAEPELPF